ncbi:RDD family protein [Labilibaculum sp. A4]|uniref:RDD family protein n=1 Tax=Labilibaculum euxinus TaxID=2686357 RepID=UPI000F625CA4|nr:RDD family protein [Labilibaculum euxinus]MDQ1771153.1 RDD family protein [Labilibaculum euxinus]MWN76840.1 RDD family protein [Labilibaculum euxinus]
MADIGIETTQNVRINFQLASIGERISATLLDLLFFFVIYMILLLVIGLIGKDAVWILFLLVPLMFYSLIFEVFMNGQTPGKKIMKIKVSTVDGSAPTFLNYLIRWMFRLVDISLTYGICGILCIVIGEKGQRLGDILAKTTVIRTKRKVSIENTILVDIPQNYELVFPESRKINEKDLPLFKKVIAQIESMEDPVEKLQFGLRARKNVMEKLGIKTEMQPLEFFKTLIVDYNLIHRNR